MHHISSSTTVNGESAISELIEPASQGSSAYPPSVQSGVPKLRLTPSGWCKVPLGKHLHEVRRPIKLDLDREYTLVTVKRSRGGVEKRELLRGSEIMTPSQFLIREGDFLISKRMIVHGACGTVPRELDGAIVSNEYAVIASDGEIDLRFLSYLAATKYFQQTCFHSSIGVHVEKMIFRVEQWLKWPFNIPPLSTQRQIHQLFDTWEEAIATSEALLASANAEKRALMSLLLPPRHSSDWKRYEWQRVSIGDLAHVDSESLPATTDASFSFRYISLADINAGKISSRLRTFVFSEAPSRARRIVNPGDILMSTVRPNLHGHARLTGTHEGCIASTGFAVISASDNVNANYLYQYLFSDDIQRQVNALVTGSNYPAINSSDLRELQVSVPNKLRQDSVAKLLTIQDTRIEALRSQVAALLLEKEALMQRLFL